MSKKEKDKDKKNELSTSQILGETRNVLFGENTQLTAVLNNLVTLFSRMDSRLSSIEENTGKNTRTLKQMDDKLTSLTSRVITVENEITSVKTRVSDLETSSQGTSNLFDEIKETTETTKKGLEKIITKHQQTQFDRTKMTEDMKKLEEENSKLKEGLLDVQCRSMKNNLIFTGLSEQEGENCEGLLRDFLYYEMNIDKDIQFGNIHRFGKRPQTRDDPHRPIVARFLHYKDLELVKNSGRLLKGTHFGVREQFPPEIEDRRRLLYLIMREEKKKKSKVVLVRDRLYVNNELVEVRRDDTPGDPRRSTSRPQKRSRVNSTPERE